MKKLIALLAVILCCVGIYKITQLPPPLRYDLQGMYAEDVPEGIQSFSYLSAGTYDFYYFNDMAKVYLYGTYKKVADDQWLLKGKHIGEQTVTLTEDLTFVFQVDGQEISMKKIADHEHIVGDCKEKAIANDEKTTEEVLGKG